MAAGVRSLLAFWSGGAGALTPTTQAGVRGLLAPWMGGAGAGGVTQAGVKGLLAFWMGGAASLVEATTAPVTQAPAGRPMRLRVRQEEDEEIMLLIHAALHMLNQEHV